MDNENGFVIETDDTADWAIRSIRDTEHERDRLISIAQHQIDELNEQIERIKEKYNRKTGFLRGCLYDYMQKVPHKKTKTQDTYQLLSGKLILKNESQKLVPSDKLVDYLESEKMNDLIKIKKSADWANFKSILKIVDGNVVNTTTGETIDPNIVSIEITPASFDVKPTEGEEDD